jgi:hypothetical protein
MIKKVLVFVFLIFQTTHFFAQENKSGQIHGNFGFVGQTYKEDSLIGAPFVAEKFLMNAYSNVLFTKGGFTAGVRFETYLNALEGYDKRYNGIALPYRFISYQHEKLNFLLGNFYEQFGNGLILRTYEDKDLGIDNSLDGARVIYQPIKGITIKGLVGKQRFYYEHGPGIVRGIDGEFYLNDFLRKISDKKLHVTLGGSFVSKFQPDDDPVYILPENVGAGAGRVSISHGGFLFKSEYAYKSQDPSADNGYIYKTGEALLLSMNYSKKGFGLFLNAKRVDNMSFRSDRNAKLTDLNINNIPATAKTHTYALATLYPYASQPNGEMGMQGEFNYRFNRNSFLGKKLRMFLTVGFSQVNSIKKTFLSDGDGYTSDFFEIGDELYFRDIFVELEMKFSKKMKGIFHAYHQEYNKDVLQGLSGYGIVKSNIFVADINYKLKPKHNLRTELQLLTTKQDKGNWLMVLMEYSIAPHWFFTVFDMYNYGNPKPDKRIHYYSGNFAYSNKGTRIQLGYGRVWEGIICVGGVCRNVPASNGFTINITSSF